MGESSRNGGYQPPRTARAANEERDGDGLVALNPASGSVGVAYHLLATTTTSRAVMMRRCGVLAAWELRTSISLGILWRNQNRLDDARKLVGSSYAGFAEGSKTTDLQAARQLLEELGG